MKDKRPPNKIKEALKKLSPRGSDEPDRLKSVNITLRTWPHLRDQLQEAAEARGRSLSQEVEARLVQTFSDDQLLPALLFGSPSETPTLLRLILSAIHAVETTSLAFAVGKHSKAVSKRWSDDPDVASNLFYALMALLHAVLIDGVRLQDKEAARQEAPPDFSGMNWPEHVAQRVLLGAGFGALPGAAKGLGARLAVDDGEAASPRESAGKWTFTKIPTEIEGARLEWEFVPFDGSGVIRGTSLSEISRLMAERAREHLKNNPEHGIEMLQAELGEVISALAA